MPHQRAAADLRAQAVWRFQLARQVAGDKGFKHFLHRKQQRRRLVAARAGERRIAQQNQPCPRQRALVVPHIALQPHALEIQRRLLRLRHLGEHKAQLARQLLMRLRARPVQHAPQRRMQQAVGRAIDGKLVKLRKKAVAAAEVVPQMRSHEQLAAQRNNVVLPRVVGAAQPALDDALHRAQKLADEHFP